MKIISKLKYNSDKSKLRNKIIVLIMFLGFLIIIPSISIFNDNILNSINKSIMMPSSSSQNYSGDYNGGIATMGLKLNSGIAKWMDTTSVNTTVPHNTSYYGLEYSLNRLDILTLNLYNGSGSFSIANNDTNKVLGYNESAILAQEFTAPLSADLLAIDTINLYIDHGLIAYRYKYYVVLYDENFSTILASNTSVHVQVFGLHTWKSFRLSSNILYSGIKYNIVFFIATETSSGLDGEPNFDLYKTNSWMPENKSITSSEIKGITRKFNGINFVNISQVNEFDMLSNFTFFGFTIISHVSMYFSLMAD